MRQLIAVALFCAAIVCFKQYADAQVPMTGAGLGAPPSGATFTGPGDVVSGAGGWWGLRAYSSGTTGTAAVDLIRASDSATCTGVKTLSNGNLDISGSTAYCSTSQTVTAFCNGTTCRATKLYDQTGNANHLTQATAANQPTFTLSCLNSLPCLSPAGGQVLTSGSTVNVAQVWWINSVSNETSATSGSTFGDAAGSVTFVHVGGSDQLQCHAGNNPTVASTHNTWHAVQFVGNGASSICQSDTTSSTVNAGTNAIGNGADIDVLDDSFGNVMTGKWVEAGYWATNPSGTQQTNMCKNEQAYWGSGNFGAAC